MTKAERKRLKKNRHVCRQRWLWAKAKPPMKFFKTVLLLPTAMRVFFQLLECSFWRGLCPEATNKKCLHTASTLCQASLAGFARWLHLRGIILLGGVSVSPLSTPRCGLVCISPLCPGFCAPYKFEPL
jgi:hypothetical protein